MLMLTGRREMNGAGLHLHYHGRSAAR